MTNRRQAVSALSPRPYSTYGTSLSAEDKRLLEEMIVDRSTPSSLRTVATAIVNLTHTITDEDRSALEALLE